MNHRRNTVDKLLCSLYEDVEASWRLTSNLSRAWLLEKHFLLNDRRSHSDSFICLEKVFYFFPALLAFDFNTVNDLHKAWLTIAHLNGAVWHLWILLERFTTVFSMETCLLNPRTSRPSVRLLSLKITLKQMCHQDHSEVYECECETCDGGRWASQVMLILHEEWMQTSPRSYIKSQRTPQDFIVTSSRLNSQDEECRRIDAASRPVWPTVRRGLRNGVENAKRKFLSQIWIGGWRHYARAVGWEGSALNTWLIWCCIQVVVIKQYKCSFILSN